MKILLLSNMFPSMDSPNYGVFVRNILESLRQHGFDVEKVVIEGRRSNILGKLLAYVSFGVKAFCRALFTNRVVYVHFVAHTAVPVLAASLFRRLCIVAHVHGGDVKVAEHETPWLEKVKQALSKKLLTRADKVVVPSHHYLELVCKQYDLEREKVFVSPSGGVDTAVFTVNEPSSVSEEQKCLRLGYVGRLDPGKGVSTLLKACQSLIANNFSFQLTIVGHGQLESALQSQAKEFGLTGEVAFVGMMDQRDLTKIYTTFDYLVFPSELDESLGLVGLEAMACGVPIITTGNAGIAEYFLTNINGYVFASGDYKSLANSIENAAKPPSDEYAKLVKGSLETASDFDSRKVMFELASFFLNDVHI